MDESMMSNERTNYLKKLSWDEIRTKTIEMKRERKLDYEGIAQTLRDWQYAQGFITEEERIAQGENRVVKPYKD